MTSTKVAFQTEQPWPSKGIYPEKHYSKYTMTYVKRCSWQYCFNIKNCTPSKYSPVGNLNKWWYVCTLGCYVAAKKISWVNKTWEDFYDTLLKKKKKNVWSLLQFNKVKTQWYMHVCVWVLICWIHTPTQFGRIWAKLFSQLLLTRINCGSSMG